MNSGMSGMSNPFNPGQMGSYPGLNDLNKDSMSEEKKTTSETADGDSTKPQPVMDPALAQQTIL